MAKSKVNKLNKEDLQACLDCSLELKQIAARYNCNSITVTDYLKKFGLNSNFKKDLNLDINELYKLRVISQWNFEDLAELYKCSQAGITKLCVRLKFPQIKINRLQNFEIIEKIEVTSILLQSLYDTF